MSGAEQPLHSGWARMVVLHKHPISARLRFMLQPDGSLCAFGSVPSLAVVVDDSSDLDAPAVTAHPGSLLSELARWLELSESELAVARGFCAHLDVPGDPLTVYLAHFTGMDPPFDAVERVGGRFVELPQARRFRPVEQELMRLAYVHEMEG